MLCLAETESTRCSKCGSRCNDLAWVGKPWLSMFITAASLYVAAARLLFRCSELVFHPSERSLPCDFWTYNIIVETLCWNDYVYLIRIDCYDELISGVRDGTLTYAYTCDISNKSLDYDMTPSYLVICE